MIVVTVNELSLPELGKNYLFRFTNEQNQKALTARLPLVLSNNRYDMFSLNEGTTVNFPMAGDYRYEVFQMSDDTATDLSTGRLVETGKAEVELAYQNNAHPQLTSEKIAIYGPQ